MADIFKQLEERIPKKVNPIKVKKVINKTKKKLKKGTYKAKATKQEWVGELKVKPKMQQIIDRKNRENGIKKPRKALTKAKKPKLKRLNLKKIAKKMV